MIIKTFDRFDGFVKYALETPQIFKKWRTDRIFTWNRVLIAQTGDNRVVVFSENLLKRIYAWLVDCYQLSFILGDHYQRKLKAKNVVFLQPSQNDTAVLRKAKEVFDRVESIKRLQLLQKVEPKHSCPQPAVEIVVPPPVVRVQVVQPIVAPIQQPIHIPLPVQKRNHAPAPQVQPAPPVPLIDRNQFYADKLKVQLQRFASLPAQERKTAIEEILSCLQEVSQLSHSSNDARVLAYVPTNSNPAGLHPVLPRIQPRVFGAMIKGFMALESGWQKPSNDLLRSLFPAHQDFLNALADRLFAEPNFYVEQSRMFIFAFTSANLLQLPWDRYEPKVIKRVVKLFAIDRLLMMPRNVLRKHFDAVASLEARVKLLQVIDDEDRRHAFSLWWTTIDFTKLNSLGFPYGEMIDLVGEPSRIVKLVQSAGENSFLKIMSAFEKNPWKLWVALANNAVDFKQKAWLDPIIKTSYPNGHEIVTRWNECQGKYSNALLQLLKKMKEAAATGKWREAGELLNAMRECKKTLKTCFDQGSKFELRTMSSRMAAEKYGKACEFLRSQFPFYVIFDKAKVDQLIRKGHWQEVIPIHEEFNRQLDRFESMCTLYLLSSVQGPSPEELARDWPLQEIQVLAAFKDPSGRSRLVAAFATGMLKKEELRLLSDFMTNFLKQLSPKQKDAFEHAFSIGGEICPLNKQFHCKQNADLTLQVGKEQIAVHRPLLSLDPYFAPLLTKESTLMIPPDAEMEVKLRLRQIYGLYSIQEVFSEAGQKELMQRHERKLSLAPLLNSPSCDVVLEVEGKEIKAHKFILAASFEFFERLFASGMKEVGASPVIVNELSYEQVAAVIEYVYTNERPEFENIESETAFEEVFKLWQPPIV